MDATLALHLAMVASIGIAVLVVTLLPAVAVAAARGRVRTAGRLIAAIAAFVAVGFGVALVVGAASGDVPLIL